MDPNKEVCFDISESGQSPASTIDCFVPNDFKRHIAGIGDVASYQNALRQSKVLNVTFLPDSEKSEFLKFYDRIQPMEVGTNYLQEKARISKALKSTSPSKEDYEEWIYILTLEGNYRKAEKIEAEYCSKFDCKDRKIAITISGKVYTGSGNSIPGATVRVVGGKDAVRTSSDGGYSITISTFPERKLRVEAFKPGFSNAVYVTDILSSVKKQSQSKDFVINAPVQYAIIDTMNKSIQGERTGITGSGFTVKTAWSQYLIPTDSLVHKDGKPFKGKVTAYFFEFDKNSHNEDLLQNDIFDDVVGYAGNLMKTFGMPYVLFVTDEGERIHVLKANPMLLQNKISEMEALRTNKDKIYSPLTDADLEFLVNKSKELGGYPITREFLIENNMLRYPVFWVFDQTK